MLLTLGVGLVALAVEEETGPCGKDCVGSIAEVSMGKGKLLKPSVKAAAASSSAIRSHGPCKTTTIKPITSQHCPGFGQVLGDKIHRLCAPVTLALGQGHQLFALNPIAVIILQSFNHLTHTHARAHTHTENRPTLKTMPRVT